MNEEKYKKEISNFAFDLSQFNGTTLLISGATGMVGKYLIDTILSKGVECRIVALGRSEGKAKQRFKAVWDDSRFVFYETDLSKVISFPEKPDFIIHAASNTHPLAYSTDPIGTISANVIGLKNLLDFAACNQCRRFVFLSSVEVYGENRGDVESFSEEYCGYIDCNTLRAGYPESKRVGEALCQAYVKQKSLDIVIPRLSRIFGPTLLESDTKALSQFLHKALQGEDIILKSAGNQYYSYLYVEDAVSGILTCMLYGHSGEAYNIANSSCNITLKELAQTIADLVGRKVIFELPDETEKAGYSTATKAILNSQKIEYLGWHGKYGIADGIGKTIEIMKD